MVGLQGTNTAGRTTIDERERIRDATRPAEERIADAVVLGGLPAARAR